MIWPSRQRKGSEQRRFMAQGTISHEDVVIELYRGLLGREPDPAGLKNGLAAIASGSTTLSEYIRRFTSSDEFAQILAGSGFQFSKFTNDVSQHGEVWYLIKNWINISASHKIVVDVGARGRERSNSYDLLKHFCWKGLLIEANANLIDSIQREFSGLDHKIIPCAVSDYDGQGKLTIGINDDVSSLAETEAARWGKARGSIEVDVRRLPDVLDENEIPCDFDLLSLDIEGEDVKVFNDLIGNSPYRPRWALIEIGPPERLYKKRQFSSAVLDTYIVRDFVGPNAVMQLRAE